MDVFTQRNGAAAGQPLCSVVMATVDDGNRLPAAADTTRHCDVPITLSTSHDLN